MPDFIRNPDVRNVTAGANLISGDVVLTADRKAGYVEAQRGILNGERGIVRTSGLLSFAKANASDVIPAGARIQYNSSTKLASVLDSGVPASGSFVVGIASEASGNGVATVIVELNGQGETSPIAERVRMFRRRCTTAEINAGVTLLPAKAGVRYRMVDATLIAIGGAASGATSVNISATQSTAAVNLIAAAVAGLTQSTVARAGAANIAVLADGASFVDNDVNTAIAVNKTGSNLATSTAVDVLFFYVEQPA